MSERRCSTMMGVLWLVCSYLLWQADAQSGDMPKYDFEQNGAWRDGLEIRSNKDNNWHSFTAGDDLIVACGVHSPSPAELSSEPAMDWAFNGKPLRVDEEHSSTERTSRGWISTIYIKAAGTSYFGVFSCNVTVPSFSSTASLTLTAAAYTLYREGEPRSFYVVKYGGKASITCHSFYQSYGVRCLVIKLDENLKRYPGEHNWGESCQRTEAEKDRGVDHDDWSESKRQFDFTVRERNSGFWQCEMFRKLRTTLGTRPHLPPSHPNVTFEVRIEEIAPESAILSTASANFSTTIVVGGTDVPPGVDSTLYLKDWTPESDANISIICAADAVAFPHPKIELKWQWSGKHRGDTSQVGRNHTAGFLASQYHRLRQEYIVPDMIMQCSAENKLGRVASRTIVKAGSTAVMYPVEVTTTDDALRVNTTITAHVFGTPLGQIRPCVKLDQVTTFGLLLGSPLSVKKRICSKFQPSNASFQDSDLSDNIRSFAEIQFSWSTGHHHNGHEFRIAQWTISRDVNSQFRLNSNDSFQVVVRDLYAHASDKIALKIRYADVVSPSAEHVQRPQKHVWLEPLQDPSINDSSESSSATKTSTIAALGAVFTVMMLLAVVFIFAYVKKTRRSRGTLRTLPYLEKQESYHNCPLDTNQMTGSIHYQQAAGMNVQRRDSRLSMDSQATFLESLSPMGKEPFQPGDFGDLLVDAAQIKVGEEIGRGAFGVVHRGSVRNLEAGQISTDVALKIAKDESVLSVYAELAKEVCALKDLGRRAHPNVMSMLGICLNDQPILIMELAEHGSLLDLLRNRRGAKQRVKQQMARIDSVTSFTDTSVSKRFSAFSSLPHLEDVLRPNDMFSFARQIARGLEFLAAKGFVHRDLAARNILISSDYTLKISDFGHSRHVDSEDGIYHPTSTKHVPVKWYAIESLLNGEYTTKSDVWSFGIVLWEIATLGCSPYPGVAPQNMLPLLKSGNRMARPDCCPEALYSLMAKCWEHDPTDRPSFSHMVELIDKHLQETAKSEQGIDYLSLDALHAADAANNKANEQPASTGVGGNRPADLTPSMKTSKTDLCSEPARLASPSLLVPDTRCAESSAYFNIRNSRLSPIQSSVLEEGPISTDV